jgi:SAM-dependent methyltransferase
MPAYRWLAPFYDDLFSSAHSPIDAGRNRLLAAILPKVTAACDLACGTGTTALELSRRGIQVYAVDASPGMCRLTRKKAREADLKVRIIRGDLQTFRLPEQVDLITCEGDALNHVPRHADPRRVARAVGRALRPGGHFFFDVNNSKGFESYWKGDMWVEKPGVVLVMRNNHNLKLDKAWSDIEIFVREGRTWRRHHERVEEVCWASDEIRRVFRAAGFDSVLDWDAAPFFNQNSIGPGCRSFYLARKALGCVGSMERIDRSLN